MQLVMLIKVKVVLFTGLRGEPTENKTKARHIVVKNLSRERPTWSFAVQPSTQGRQLQTLPGPEASVAT